MSNHRHVRSVSALLFAALLTACGDNGGAMPEMPPPAVGVMTVSSASHALRETLPGRLEASRVAEVRARVSGIVEQRLFTEGSDVKAGELLFRIDDAPYAARRDAAEASVASADAALYQARYQAERYESLRQDNAVSEHDLVRAKAELKQAEAALLAARAELKAATIDLQYTRVTAPVSGRIGRGFVTEGALVSQAEATPMALIQQIDPMYINLQQDSRRQFQRYLAASAGRLTLQQRDAVDIELLLDDGSVYPHKGRLLFSDINVDSGTGQRTLRVEMPNPDGLLLPGMFVQARLAQVVYEQAFLLPQQAVMRSDQGDSVFVVGKDNVLQLRQVTVAGSSEGRWLVVDGLQDGDVVMTDGFQKARPGGPVQPVFVDSQGE